MTLQSCKTTCCDSAVADRLPADAKAKLRLAIAGTCRGGSSSPQQRGQVAEAQAALESQSEGISLAQLQGLWRLVYTTAPDVVSECLPGRCQSLPPRLTTTRLQGPIIGIGGSAPLVSLLPLTTANIYQRFSSQAVGLIENIIQLSLPPLLRPGTPTPACRQDLKPGCSSLLCRCRAGRDGVRQG